MARGFHSTAILVVVFVLGLAAGIAGMVWAWPGLHARYFDHKREPFLHHMQATLQLSSDQVTKVQGVFSEAGKLRHSVHEQYAPQYEQLCEQFVQVQQKERDTYLQSPQRQQLLDQLHGIMSNEQWLGWQKLQAENHHPRRDPCKHPQSTNSPSNGSHR